MAGIRSKGWIFEEGNGENIGKKNFFFKEREGLKKEKKKKEKSGS